MTAAALREEIRGRVRDLVLELAREELSALGIVAPGCQVEARTSAREATAGSIDLRPRPRRTSPKGAAGSPSRARPKPERRRSLRRRAIGGDGTGGSRESAALRQYVATENGPDDAPTDRPTDRLRRRRKPEVVVSSAPRSLSARAAEEATPSAAVGHVDIIDTRPGPVENPPARRKARLRARALSPAEADLRRAAREIALEEPDASAATYETPPQNGPYRGSAPVRELPTGISGEDLQAGELELLRPGETWFYGDRNVRVLKHGGDVITVRDVEGGRVRLVPRGRFLKAARPA